MKKLNLLALLMCICFIFTSVTALADEGDEVLADLTARFNDDTQILLKIPFGDDDDELDGECRNPQLQIAANGFTLTDDGKIFVLNDNAKTPQVLAYSTRGIYLYSLSCTELAQPENPQADNFCPVQDIQYCDGYLFAVAYYNDEKPCLIKYSLEEKTTEKLRFPTEFLDSLDEYSDFEDLFAVGDNIVICCSTYKYLTYSVKEAKFLDEPIVQTAYDRIEKTFTVKCKDVVYTISTLGDEFISVLGQSGDLYLSRVSDTYPMQSGLVKYNKHSHMTGKVHKQVDGVRFGRHSLEVSDGKLYRACEDTKFFYVYKCEMNEEYIKTGIADINGDGQLNTGDATYRLKCCARIIDYEYEPSYVKLDVNRDGYFNTGDVAYILRGNW